MTTDAAEPTPRRPGALREVATNTIYLITGGLLVSVPAIGGFATASLIISAVMLSPDYTNLSPEEIALAQTSLIVLPALIGLVTIILCFFLARLHRSRARALLKVHMPRPARSRRGWRRLLSLGFTPYALRMLAYHLIGLLWGPLMILLALVLLIGGPALVFFAFSISEGLLLMALLYGASGIALVLGSPWILQTLTNLDLALLRWVNGVSEKAVLAQRVQQVTDARSAVVAAADAERRRIERNLHDGAQQRLTALAVNLGIERSRLRQATSADDSPDAQQTQRALQYAQTEVQTALQEIRYLVRGLHPAVLEDRGLDAAVSGIASRTALPVAVEVEVPRRPALVIETVAYFVISEAVNNIIAHAHATQASITVTRSGDTLQIAIEDDGVGGADERGGTGLTGLRQRVESVDGTLEIVSTVLEGTQVRVELPCE